MNIDVTLVVTVIVAVIAGLSAVVASAYTAKKTAEIKKLELEHKETMDLREKMKEPYRHFISLFLSIMRDVEKKKLTQESINEKADELAKEIILTGSNKALSSWSAYRLNSANANKSTPKKIFDDLEDVLFTMREDLGFEKDNNIKRGDIMSLFINDYHQMK